MKVYQLMTKDVATIAETASLKEAARIMIERKVSGLPVTNTGHGLVGVVTEGDILHRESMRSPSTTLRSFFRSKAPASTTVAEAMTRKVVTIDGESDHTEAARLMESAGVKRLPVVNNDGILLGIISRSDILKVFGRSDTDIADEISAEVIERILWLDPRAVAVAVESGNVLLTGRVPTKSDARILEEMSKRIDGVVAVEAGHLAYDVDDTRRSDSPLSGQGPGSRW